MQLAYFQTWLPALVIDSANQHRKLRSQMRHDFERQPVAQSVLRSAKSNVGFLLTVGSEFQRDLL